MIHNPKCNGHGSEYNGRRRRVTVDQMFGEPGYEPGYRRSLEVESGISKVGDHGSFLFPKAFHSEGKD